MIQSAPDTRSSSGGPTPDGGTVFAIIPVFNRWPYTRACIDDLRRQTYPSVTIIVSDGGSTDGTRSALAGSADAVLVFDERTRWWAGSVALGIAEALRRCGEGDFVMLVNNDTRIPPDCVEKLVRCSKSQNAVVGAIIADSHDPDRILDAGVTIDWNRYEFPARRTIAPGETFFDRIDTLSGRGTLIPVSMVRSVSNVDDKAFPHYIADYDFFCRLKAAGFRLGICSEARVLAYSAETGIPPSDAIQPLSEVLKGIFSRRSMANFFDHRRFISRHAPADQKARLLRVLSVSTFGRLIYHTRVRSLISAYKRAAERYPPLEWPLRFVRWLL